MITIDNYEEYFLDYCEGTLDADGRREVMSFVKAHPYLREELEEFAGCPVLDDETDKAVEMPADLADSLRHTSDYDEPDVPYFDRLAVLNLEKIATPAEQLEYSRMKYESIECNRVAKLYSKTILPAEQIECPDKRRMMVFPIWRKWVTYAAAAAVVGLMVWFSIGNNATVTITSPAAPSVAVDNLRPSVVQDEEVGGTQAARLPRQENDETSRQNNVADTKINVPNKAANIIDEVISCGNEEEVVGFEIVEVDVDEVLQDTTSLPIVADEPSAPQTEPSSLQVELLPFDDLTDDFDDFDNNNKKHRHRKKFWFACGKALKYVARRFVPNVHFDMDRNADGKITRVAMYAENKVYTVERKEKQQNGAEL
ncbi:MAG: hypothetical protein II075_12815 [Bacteroidales bacterium]|nr:hypothetical protein [Bacteroidales bacterium]